ncbi:MAG: hypothetical protein DRP55_07015, partial [Spirochaetes bacterium]
VSDGTYSGSTNDAESGSNITWVVGSLHHFTITGYPNTIASGDQFPSPANDVIVTAYDQYNNIKTDYTGTVTFTSSDATATLPANYTFTIGGSGDNGQHTFTGSNFTLNTLGNQTITVSDTINTNVSVTTNVINVTSNAIDSFQLTATNPANVVAGQPFELQVTNAIDLNGNPANGTVVISWFSSTSGQQNAPDGSTPSFTNINVTNGSGSAYQTLVRADTNVVLRGTVQSNGKTDDTDGADVITVNPAPIDHFTFTTNPAATETAGANFNVVVEARDAFDNPVTSGTNAYNGTADISDTTTTIYEASGGPGDTNISFSSGTYNGNLVITKAQNGNVQITVTDTTDTSITGQSASFTVQPAIANHFTITTSITSPKTAGEAIPLRIEVRDQYDNVLSFGVNTYNIAGIVLDDSDGTANTTINPGTIDFTNGVWEGVITITEATPVTLRVGFGSGLTPDTAGPITINPAPLDHFVFTANPDPYVKVGEDIPIVIEARDKYDNVATGFSGSASINDIPQTIYEAPPVGTGTTDQTIAFTSGIYNGNVRVPEVFKNDFITVISGSASGSSSLFTIVGNNVIVTLNTDDNSATAPKVALSGTTIDMLEFTLTNLDPTDNMTINGFKIYTESGKDSTIFTINPSTLIDGIYVYETTSGSSVLIGQNLAPNNSKDAVSINLTNSLTINSSGGYKKVKIAVHIKRDISRALVKNILLRIGDVDGEFNTMPVVPVDPSNEDFESIKIPENYIRSGLTNLRSDKKEAAFNYPNPFNPRSQSTKIAFYNSVDNGKVSIKIYTITGRLVRDLSLKTAQPEGSIEVEWDGRNGRGRIVRNGVYVAIIHLADGTKILIKIAVVK